MTEIKLTRFLNKIEKQYGASRAKWEKLAEEYQIEMERFDKTNWMNYTPQGMTELRNKHQAKLDEIKLNMSKVKSEFDTFADGVINECDKVFKSLYQYSPKNVDMNGVAILQNGSPSIDEIIKLAEEYRQSNNFTMYYMFADKLKSDKAYELMTPEEQRGRAYYIQANERRAQREDKDCLSGFALVCSSALRDNILLSNGVDAIHEETYTNHLEVAERIKVELDTPWNE